jgi:hypothetical protein
MCHFVWNLKKEILIWLKNLKFSDGYADFRRAVNLESGKLSGVKSHDYHIFMQRLLPVMFHGYLDNDVWMALAELNHFLDNYVLNKLRKR